MLLAYMGYRQEAIKSIAIFNPSFFYRRPLDLIKRSVLRVLPLKPAMFGLENRWLLIPDMRPFTF